MADTVTESDELVITLAGNDTTYTRTIRISDPNTTSGTTLATIRQALAPAFAYDSSDTSTANIVGFFCDDNNPDVQMTQIIAAERVRQIKTTTKYS